MQLYNKVLIDTTLPDIGDRSKEIYLPIETDETRKEKIKLSVKKVFEEKWRDIKDIEKIREEFDNIVT